jgi:transposase-like protein
MKTVKRERYSNDFKDHALAMVGPGRTKAEVAQELGIGTCILYRWSLARGGGLDGEAGEEADEGVCG